MLTRGLILVWLGRICELCMLFVCMFVIIIKMLDYNDDRLFDLPLQVKCFPYNQKSNRQEDRPKQMEKDQYRVSSSTKDNGVKACKRNIHNTASKPKKQPDYKCTSQKQNKLSTTGKKNRNENLRNIIKKQLFSNQKASLKNINPKDNPPASIEINKENKLINRYQQLLCQVYGQPKPKQRTNTKNMNVKIPLSIQRHTSVKAMPLKDEKVTLQRYRSATDLSKNTPCLISELAHIGRPGTKLTSPTYLQLYKQKRKPFLLL